MTFRFAYFAEFKSGPKILVWGDETAMRAFEGLLWNLAHGGNEISLDQTGTSVGGISVTAVPAARALGIREAKRGTKAFDWVLDANTAETFAEMVAILAMPGARGHHYLEPVGGVGEITVMVSVGEYPPNLHL